MFLNLAHPRTNQFTKCISTVRKLLTNLFSELANYSFFFIINVCLNGPSSYSLHILRYQYELHA